MNFNWYGLMIGIGVLVGNVVIEKVKVKLEKLWSGYKNFKIDDLILVMFIPALVFARIYHVVDYWKYYKENLVKILFVWEGGLAIYGAIFGGVLGIFFYNLFKYKNKWKINFIRSLDLLVFGAPIAQAFGRMGNYFNQELFGLPTKLVWGVYINIENRPIRFISETKFHPLFFYEAILNMGLLFLMIKSINSKKKKGFYFCFYIVGYGIIRFCLDFLRIDPWRLGIFTIAQWIGLGIILAGLFYILHMKSKAES